MRPALGRECLCEYWGLRGGSLSEHHTSLMGGMELSLLQSDYKNCVFTFNLSRLGVYFFRPVNYLVTEFPISAQEKFVLQT